jgi:outer membrane protein
MGTALRAASTVIAIMMATAAFPAATAARAQGTAPGTAGGGATTAPAGPLKLAFIRSQDIFAQAPGRADAEAQFNKELEAARAQEKAMGDSINGMFGDYAKVEPTLATDAKQSRQQAIRDKQQQFQQRQQQLEQQVQQRQGELVQPILERINHIINDLRAENGYAMVFDAQANGGGLVAADKSLDITDQVITRLKAAGPPAPVANAPAAPTTPSGKSTTRPGGPTSTPSGVTRPKSPSP